jgi:hypothetical protein
MTANGSNQTYCSNSKIPAFSGIMILLLVNRLVLKPSSVRTTVKLTIVGYLLLNVFTFIHTWRGIYLIYGNHKDNGVKVMTSSSMANKAMAEVLKHNLPEIYKKNGLGTGGNVSDDATSKALRLKVANRLKDYSNYKKMVELRKIMLKRMGKPPGGHSEVHTFFNFVPSEDYECLQSGEKTMLWILIVSGMISSLPFGLFVMSIAISFICSPLILIILCCCKDRNIIPFN